MAFKEDQELSKKIDQEIETINAHAGGSTLTKVARATALGHVFDVWRQELNLQVTSLALVKTAHIAAYVKHELEAGKSLRSIQNEMSHVRTGLKHLGREQFAKSDPLSNRAMGLAGASRDGTHRALTPEQYDQVLSAARDRDAGFSICVEMQRELGLRAREAVQSVASLKAWEKALAKGQDIKVIHGTKGGKPRLTGALNPEKALVIVRSALSITQGQKGNLIPSTSLQGAMRAYGRHGEAVGLKGEHASHALRYSYAQDRFAQHMIATGGDRKESLALTSLDLGHGDGRGTYVDQVYSK
jgi:site-specific recombinase XerD